MQIMVIEYARNVLGLKDASSTEFSPETRTPVVSLLEEQVDIKAYGGTMRLGKSDTRLKARNENPGRLWDGGHFGATPSSL